MHSFKGSVHQHISITNSDEYCHSQPPFCLRGDESGRHGACITDLGELDKPAGNGFHHVDSLSLSRSSVYNGIKASNVPIVSSNLQFGGLPNSSGLAEIGPSGGGVETGQLILQKGGNVRFTGSSSSGSRGSGAGGGSLGKGHLENWEDSEAVADHRHHTDASTDTDDKNQFLGVHHERMIVLDSMDRSKARVRDQKALLKLAQNREAARKSRMRKKAYVQQLESSRQRLIQLEQDLKRARQQGIVPTSGFSEDKSHSIGGSGRVAFDIDYARWLDEHQRLINKLRSAVNSHLGESQLQLAVDAVMSHYDELFRIKSSGAKSDIFHILSGIWKTPVERCFMWLGGFRCSDVLKVLGSQIEPLTEQQLVGICNLRQSSQQFEDALSEGVEALQQSIVETLSYDSLAPRSAGNVVDFMDQMAIAISKIATLENFLHQADLLRLQTLQQLQRILTTRQVARALLAINDYKSRLRALSSLWLARPKE